MPCRIIVMEVHMFGEFWKPGSTRSTARMLMTVLVFTACAGFLLSIHTKYDMPTSWSVTITGLATTLAGAWIAGKFRDAK